jgi:SAM-dependent methyltransferase
MEEDRYTPEATSAAIADSLASSEPLPKWWDRAHETDHLYWLTGSEAKEVWNRLSVTGRIRPGAEVLNIGVGMGRDTRDLAKAGCRVSVLDISPIALKRVADVAPGYLAADLAALPDGKFDFALSHLVAQHMTDGDLVEQIRHVLRALKPGGFLAMQYASHPVLEAPVQSGDNLRGGSVYRTENAFKAVVQQAGGAVKLSKLRESHPCGTIWRVAHIVPRRPWWKFW